MTIISPLPNNFINGTTADAPQVDANFAQIVDNVNDNAAASGANSDITSLSGLTTPIPSAAGGVPTGAMMAFAVVTPPSGWLLCDGSAVSRATYAALFGLIGTTYGAGDMSTTFNVPDMRGRVAAGYDAANASGRLTGSPTGGVSAAAVANAGGEQGHTLVTGELAAHSHGVTDPGHTHAVTDPGHVHALANAGNVITDVSGALAVATSPPGAALSASQVASHTTGLTNQSATTGLTTNNAGSDSSHNTVQPTLITAWIIKT